MQTNGNGTNATILIISTLLGQHAPGKKDHIVPQCIMRVHVRPPLLSIRVFSQCTDPPRNSQPQCVSIFCPSLQSLEEYQVINPPPLQGGKEAVNLVDGLF